MRTVLRFAAIAFAAVLTITPFVGAWSSFGAYEPDTQADVLDGYMWLDADNAAGDRIYFNAWSSTQALVNYNTGTLESSIEAPEMDRPLAILGVWVDCNGDGFVGHAESALYEYPSTLLLDDSDCPSVRGEDANAWVQGAHNYNGVVSELIPIGRPPADGNMSNVTDARVYHDSKSKIWADIGTPEGVPGGSCAINPFPRGTMQSTGGLLNYLDCRYEVIDAINTGLSQVPGGDAFAFDDSENASVGDSPLDQPNPAGDEHTDHAAASVNDCTWVVDTGATANESGVGAEIDGVVLTANQTSGEDLGDGWEYYTVKVPAINPVLMNTQDPSAAGQFNQTNEESVVYSGQTGYVGGDCDPNNDAGHDFYGTLNEGEWASDNSRRGKQASFWSFQYFEGSRGDVEDNAVGLGLDSLPNVPGDGSAGTAGDLGIGGPVHFLLGTTWYGIGNMIKDHGQSFAVRNEFNETDPLSSNVGAGPQNGFTVTYYAYVSSEVTDLGFKTANNNVVSLYGGHACDAGDVDPSPLGWDCDETRWNRNEDGTPLAGQEWFAAVKDPYNLRDIDCYDGNIGFNDLNVGVQVESLGEGACVRPA